MNYYRKVGIICDIDAIMRKRMYAYKQPYVKFFRHRNKIFIYDDFDIIKQETISDRRIKNIIDELKDWPCYEITNHKNVEHPIHKLSFLAELGFTIEDKGIDDIVVKILKHQSDNGPFNILINVPKKFGGTGEAVMSWVMSDAPVIIYSLLKLCKGIDDKIRRAIEYIAALASENGWHCFASKELGKFRGPGRKDDPCPYATMFTLKMLALTDESQFLDAKKIGLKSIQDLWERRKETKPYLFAMGTDFKKLKLPFVWYDILNMVDTLSQFKTVRNKDFFIEMLNIILEKENEHGFIPESIYLKAKEWDFGQKKEPSEYMNAIIERIKARVYGGP
jgi:hypothetical protein